MKKTQLMGILNCTPDSFFDGGRCDSIDLAVLRGLEMVEEGVDLIDIGGESTRPGAKIILEDIEIQRVIPVIKALSGKIPLSIDTSKPQVALAALQAGASLINDVTGFTNETMCKIAQEFSIKICVMHAQGTPQNMQDNPTYPNGVVNEIMEWFKKKCDALIKRGIEPKNIIIDPGIGFGKTVPHTIEILQNLPKIKSLGFKLLLGISRKSFMQKIVQKSARDVLSTTLALNTMGILQGVDLIRVHDVKEHRDIIDILQPFT